MSQPLPLVTTESRRPTLPPLSRLLRAAAVTYALLLAYLLLAPRPLFFLGATGASIDESVEVTMADWIQHASAYLVLSVLLALGFGGTQRLARLAAVAFLHGGAAEVAQQWIPMREFGWSDLAGNLAGVLAGVLVVAACGRWWRRRRAAAMSV